MGFFIIPVGGNICSPILSLQMSYKSYIRNSTPIKRSLTYLLFVTLTRIYFCIYAHTSVCDLIVRSALIGTQIQFPNDYVLQVISDFQDATSPYLKTSELKRARTRPSGLTPSLPYFINLKISLWSCFVSWIAKTLKCITINVNIFR